MAVFEKFRISLDPRGPSQLLEGLEPPIRSRRDYLISAFADQREFLPSRGRAKIAFLPIPSPDGYVAGFFGRQRKRHSRRGPEAAFSPVQQEDWEIALFVMNIASDSQIGWMQVNSEVGTPKAILEAFFNTLRSTPALSDYRAAVRYMDTEREYWKVVHENRDRITKLSFVFLPPNALKMRQIVADFTRLVNEQAHPDTQEHIYRADPGKMDPEAPVIAASAEIAMEGGGDAEVMAGKRKLYSSSDARTTKTVDDEELPTPSQPTFLRRVIDRLGL